MQEDTQKLEAKDLESQNVAAQESIKEDSQNLGPVSNDYFSTIEKESNSYTNLRKVNKEIYKYWVSCRSQVERKRLSKKPKGSFFRHNYSTYKRISAAWRNLKGNRNKNSIKRPKIGYKNNTAHRWRRRVDGIKFNLVYDINQLKEKSSRLASHEVIMLASRMGARSRLKCLEYSKENKIPLFINKIR